MNSRHIVVQEISMIYFLKKKAFAMGKDTRKNSLDFLICCYFGQSKDLLKAAIDRAYIDMAAHTLKGIADKSIKWGCRYEASIIIANRIAELSKGNSEYKKWHTHTIDEIIGVYKSQNITVHDGQAQKWLNMTVKYLYVFKSLLEGDERLNGFTGFLNKENEKDFYPAVDSNVLKEIGLDEAYWPWSSLDKEKYSVVVDKMKEQGCDFFWELEYWESLVENYKKTDANSYERYVEDQLKKTIEKPGIHYLK